MYSEKVINHFSNPRNMGELRDANGIGEAGNSKCGDIIKLYIKVENDVITDIRFKTFGCGAAVAVSSMITEMVKGKTIQESLSITNIAVAEALDGLPSDKMYCSLLAEEVIKAAINNYYERNETQLFMTVSE